MKASLQYLLGTMLAVVILSACTDNEARKMAQIALSEVNSCNEKVDELESEISSLRSEVDSLTSRLNINDIW